MNFQINSSIRIHFVVAVMNAGLMHTVQIVFHQIQLVASIVMKCIAMMRSVMSNACIRARARGVAEPIAMGKDIVMIGSLPVQRIVEPRMRKGRTVSNNTRMKKGFIHFVVIAGRRNVRQKRVVNRDLLLKQIELECAKRYTLH